MDMVLVSDSIRSKITDLNKIGRQIDRVVINKSEALANYEKKLAITIIKLRSGEEDELDGNKIVDPPTTIIEKIARGLCWKELLAKDSAEIQYKSLIKQAEILQAQLNGWQSIFKFQKEV